MKVEINDELKKKLQDLREVCIKIEHADKVICHLNQSRLKMMENRLQLKLDARRLRDNIMYHAYPGAVDVLQEDITE